MSATSPQIFKYSTAHNLLLETLVKGRDLLLIQDLDGVCMGLVRDPLRRQIDADYLTACKQLQGSFYVLTNGEHIGSRGVNALVEKACSARGMDAAQGLYLPGLAAGGVQYQDCFGNLSHPGVSDRELEFLLQVPAFLSERLAQLLTTAPFSIPAHDVESFLNIIVLDNAVSPTVNIGSLFDYFAGRGGLYRELQEQVLGIMRQLLALAESQDLGESFFLHLAPNLGSSHSGEVLRPAEGDDMGTTDFQFMLSGAVKEVGVLVLLNNYYFERTGSYPLGAEFNARTAPHRHDALLALAKECFDPGLMPRIMGVGDTVTSSAVSGQSVLRGGSDRGFLTLVQELGRQFASDNVVAFVDSSRGELVRPGVNPLPGPGEQDVPLSSLQGITDPDDELVLNVLFPGGHPEYLSFFRKLAGRYGD